jgi:hypothetical protein
MLAKNKNDVVCGGGRSHRRYLIDEQHEVVAELIERYASL